jgi:hypothetical protein
MISKVKNKKIKISEKISEPGRARVFSWQK